MPLSQTSKQAMPPEPPALSAQAVGRRLAVYRQRGISAQLTHSQSLRVVDRHWKVSSGADGADETRIERSPRVDHVHGHCSTGGVDSEDCHDVILTRGFTKPKRSFNKIIFEKNKRN